MPPMTIVSPTFRSKTSIPSLLKFAIMTDRSAIEKQNSREQNRQRENLMSVIDCLHHLIARLPRVAEVPPPTHWQDLTSGTTSGGASPSPVTVQHLP
jgi:hypothetical protein